MQLQDLIDLPGEQINDVKLATLSCKVDAGYFRLAFLLDTWT